MVDLMSLDPSLFITAIRKQTLCSFEDAFARDVRWSGHPGLPFFLNLRLNLMSHYDDIAAYNFAFCWSLRGDFAASA
jgi:hypothetical protein